jgi:penicillin amidase/acyl-homoserine-lactone acylase
VRESVDARYEKDLSPATRALCEAYADGVNRYAARHPDAALAPLYPVRGKDVAAGFMHKMPLFFGIDRVLRDLLEPGSPSPAPTPTGSNTLAVAPRLSADGFTRLAINSHQPWDGPVAWYEAHLKSGEGWDMVGGLFPGAPVVLHGHNRDLGWAHTVNKPDVLDVYDMETSNDHPNQYRFDGAWRDLEVRDAAIDVKLLGPLHWTFHREVLWSVYGPVVRSQRGTFAIRFSNMGDVRPVEQWYRMNRAHSFEEWLDAMRMGALPMMNCGYADRRGNIAYLYNARLPLRAEGYDWRGHVPGNTSRTLWTQYLPFERLPLVKNPPSGFVQNCNGTPFRTTTGKGNPDPADYPASLGIETSLTNRGLRALELFGADSSITREQFDAYKFDVGYSRTSAVARRLDQLLRARGSDDPLLREAFTVLQAWDLRASADSPQAALAILTLQPADDNDGAEIPTASLVARLARAARELKQHFGRIDVRWSEVNRLRRGSLDVGLGGAPDVLHAVYGTLGDDGRLVGHSGDSYVLLAEWDPQGRVGSRSIHQYGTATRNTRSRHFADQAPLFARCELKPVWLDEPEIRQHLEADYAPGER